MTNEQIISDFMQKHYTDERLTQLLAHAEDGKLSFYSCCCFIGVVTADHALRCADYEHGVSDAPHYRAAASLPGAESAEMAFNAIGRGAGDFYEQEAKRRAALIPLIREEIQRREIERSSFKSLQRAVVSV